MTSGFHPARVRAANYKRYGRERTDSELPARMTLRRQELAVLSESLDRLGLRNLAEYRASPAWQRLIGRFERQQELAKACVVCGSYHYVLHHRTYKRLGAEYMTDVVPLCIPHHNATHDLMLLREPNVTLWNAHQRLTR